MKVLKRLKRDILLLILLSGMISYLSLQTAVYISYAIDGILFHNTEKIPDYFKTVLEIDTIKGLAIISIIIMIINLAIVLANYMRERITTKFALKINSNLKNAYMLIF